MSEDRFLARWSRRKQQAKTSATPPEPGMHDEVPSMPRPAAEENAPEFDLSSLPSIDQITSATDMTAFLRKGIPQELTRAALRRAWSADPAIRDFVGLAENAWDFNDPNAMPGFGPLDCSEGELSALVDRIVGGARKAAQSLSDARLETDDSSPELPQAEPATVAAAKDKSAGTESMPVSAAPQPAVATDTEGERAAMRRRTHGGALPS
ncbi:DUF3306 domain-containing protein [Bradyrhizobium liaoningense]|uniref:DUF3306 domain-containing protein n=1 Tax=Bradyrhizobium liaoningense TaxID=43992 RepID=UPI001BAA6AF3|nr:DUF3306 domain-containing protein [Bradyrhizobium liaoningense]MBR0816670.1 DUF3306 domain-containing protein [Bradyrhizobium liaoningense]